MNYFNIMTFLSKGNKSIFDIPIKEQYQFMDRLPSPQNTLERSYNQFLCQQLFWPKWKCLTLNTIPLVAIPFAVIYLLVSRLNTKFIRKFDAVTSISEYQHVIPNELIDKYKIEYNLWNAGLSLSIKDFCYLVKETIGWYQPYFILKIFINAACYSSLIKKYRPNVLIVDNEPSFCMSFITDFCHRYGVKHIDVMHGEKLAFIRDSFFYFDECYVWNNNYIKLFVRQKAFPTQFHVAIPPCLKVDSQRSHDINKYADYKYYLSIYSNEEMKSIVDSISFVERTGHTIKFRPHPRYSDIDILKKYILEENIEWPNKVSIEESIINSKYAIGSYTTVLLQAHLAGKFVLFDDVTYLCQYDRLKDYQYQLMNETERVAKLSEQQ